MALWPAALALLGLLSLPVSAQAKEPLWLELDGGVGWLSGDHNGGASISQTTRLTYSVFTAGAGFQFSTALWNSMGAASALGGLSVPLGSLRVDVFGELGFNFYSGAGSNFLTDDPGASATLPFAGGRASVLGRVHRGRAGRELWIGLSATYADDWHDVTRTYTYRRQGTDWINGEMYDEEAHGSERVGQARIGGFAIVGVSWAMAGDARRR